jgi:RND family efflux transporter MFP subunit
MPSLRPVHRAPAALTAGLVLLFVAGSAALATIGRAAAPAVIPEPEPPQPAPSADLARPGRTEEAPPASPAPGEGLLGVILARASVDMAAPAEGRIRAVDVRIGDRVAAGGRIARIDLPDARFELEVAEASAKAAQLENDKAKVELAEAEERLERRKSLSAEALTSGEDLSAARYQARLMAVRVDATAAQMRQQRARVEQLRQANTEADIRAPFDGIVAVRYADPGARVRQGEPIVRLIAASERFVRFAVPEERASEVTVGLPVRVDADHLELAGRVEKIAPEIDAASRMVFVEAGLEQGAGTPGAVLSGEIARVWLPASKRK